MVWPELKNTCFFPLALDVSSIGSPEIGKKKKKISKLLELAIGTDVKVDRWPNGFQMLTNADDKGAGSGNGTHTQHLLDGEEKKDIILIRRRSGAASAWLPLDDKLPEEAASFLTPYGGDGHHHDRGGVADVEAAAAADHHPAADTSPPRLDGREPFDPILWTTKKRWTHILVVAFITCAT